MLDLSTVVTDLNGTPVEGKTVAGLCVDVLMATLDGDEKLAGEDKLKRFVLAERIFRTPKLALTAEEVSLLKNLTGRGYSPLAVGRIWAVIDPASVSNQ